MGLVADLNNMAPSFREPQTPGFGFRNFAYSMFAFDIQFGVRFDALSQQGASAKGSAEEAVQIGIVQNELYTRSKFVYEDTSQKNNPKNILIEFKSAAVDMIPGAKSYPFYGASGNKNPNFPPFSNARISSSKMSGPSQYGIGDEPDANLLRELNGSFELAAIERVEIFQTWLIVLSGIPFLPQTSEVAQVGQDLAKSLGAGSGRKLTVLAATEPFYMIFWADFDLSRRNSTGDPNFNWGLYGGEGFNPTVLVRKTPNFGSRPNPSLVQGDGGRAPVLDGEIAAQRVNRALIQNGLANVGT